MLTLLTLAPFGKEFVAANNNFNSRAIADVALAIKSVDANADDDDDDLNFNRLFSPSVRFMAMLEINICKLNLSPFLCSAMHYNEVLLVCRMDPMGLPSEWDIFTKGCQHFWLDGYKSFNLAPDI